MLLGKFLKHRKKQPRAKDNDHDTGDTVHEHNRGAFDTGA